MTGKFCQSPFPAGLGDAWNRKLTATRRESRLAGVLPPGNQRRAVARSVYQPAWWMVASKHDWQDEENVCFLTT